MKPSLSLARTLLAAVCAWAGAATIVFADPTTVSVATALKGADVDAGEAVKVSVTLTGSRINGRIELPKVPGLTLEYTRQYYDNNTETFSFYLTASKEGDYTLPTFVVKTQTGESLSVPAVKIHCPRIHADSWAKLLFVRTKNPVQNTRPGL